MNKFSTLNIKPSFPLVGDRVSITTLYNSTIIVEKFKKIKVDNEDAWQIQFRYREDDSKSFVTFTRSKVLGSQLIQLSQDLLPLEVVVKHENGFLFFE